MRELDHIRKPGHLAAWRELGKRIAARERAAQLVARDKAKIVRPDFTREITPALFLKRRA